MVHISNNVVFDRVFNGANDSIDENLVEGLDNIDGTDVGLDEGQDDVNDDGADDNEGGYEGKDNGADDNLDEGSFDNDRAADGFVDSMGLDDVDGPVERHPEQKKCAYFVESKSTSAFVY